MVSNKDKFIEQISDKELEKKGLNNLVQDLLNVIEGIDNSYGNVIPYLDLLYLIYLNEISKKLYSRNDEDKVLPLVEKESYSNKRHNGYFDRLFKAASILIFRLLNRKEWNIILKMDVHNCPFGSSIFSLVCGDNSTSNDLKWNFSFERDKNDSKAYSLFFLYNKFCKKKVNEKELSPKDIYTVHRDFSEKKTIRSITYQYDEKQKLVQCYDGSNDEIPTNGEKGKKLYLDFLECVLDDKFPNKESSFAMYYADNNTQEATWKTAKSFSFFNLGLSGFESWGTLMIEAFSDNAQEINDFFYHAPSEDDEREDGRQLGRIKSIISALKKIDDEYNDALNNLKIKKESTKSAISAIMSRNMSHNLGSHCMHYTKTTLDKLSNQLYGHGPEIRGAARLIGYIQARMDFLATLISGDEYPFGAVNFKSQILDILTIDDFSKRHYAITSLSNKYTTIRDSGLKDSCSELVKRLDEIVCDEAENKVEPLNQIVKGTEELIKTMDELPIDNASRRTTNFLLENLIKSEHFSREPIVTDTEKEEQINSKRFYLHILYDGETFTGKAYNKDDIRKHIKYAEKHKNREEVNKYSLLLSTAEREDKIKVLLSKLNIAMPGGIMSIHAFFNIIENLIRNSAKHKASDLKGPSLITTIAIKNISVKDRETGSKYPAYQFTIFDNKANASIVYPIIRDKLKELRVLEPNSSINKKSKGIKEMLVSALWLKSNESRYNYSDILCMIDNEKDGEEKIKLISDYAFDIVMVDDKGEETDSNNNVNANFGLRFHLPRFVRKTILEIESKKKRNTDKLKDDIILSVKDKQICADIIEIKNKSFIKTAHKIFPRCVHSGDSPLDQEIKKLISTVEQNPEQDLEAFCDTKKYYSILTKRFRRDISTIKIVFDEGANTKSEISKKQQIYFRRHFNKGDDFSNGMKYLYADSVSGGDYTVTLQENYLNGIKNGKCVSWEDKYFMLKIIESALTRITIIDERLYDDAIGKFITSNNGTEMTTSIENHCDETEYKKNEDELTMKNIRVLNLDPTAETEEAFWRGNSFKDKSDYTHFLSIHLGLIEKILGNNKNYIMKDYEKTVQDKKKKDKVVFLMDFLKKKFGRGKEIFISIHSGRGNYSDELDHSLKNYPFINLSAIESVFSNSKFLLSQLFYNTIYIGKGEYNSDEIKKKQAMS